MKSLRQVGNGNIYCASSPVGKRLLVGIGANVLLLGLVSFLTDLSSEMVLPILPMYIAALGGTAFVVGLIGGLGDSIASILKVLSGYLSDRYGMRRPFVFGGYALAATAKLTLAFSTVWGHALASRSAERVGKGLREAPRDALVADSTPVAARGLAFGVHRAMDTGGAVLGSLVAFALIWFFDFEFKAIILACAVIAFVALLPLFRVREVRREPGKIGFAVAFRTLPARLKWFVLVAGIFALGNFTYMFFILKAQDSFAGELSDKAALAIPILLYALYNVVYSLFSVPAGMISDKIGRGKVLLIGYLLFFATCLGFAFLQSLPFLVVLFLAYGLVHALVKGNERAYACDLAADCGTGTALGTLHMAIGLVALPGSLIAGALWESVDPGAAFIFGGVLALLAAVLLVRVVLRKPSQA